MNYFYNFKDHSILMAEETPPSYESISAEAFNAYFETQSKNAGSGLYFRKNQNTLELVRRNGDEPVDADAANLLDIIWIDGQGFLPTQPTTAHGLNDKVLIDDNLAFQLLVAKIDQRAIEIRDAQIKNSVYLSSEAAAWVGNCFTGTAPTSILMGAKSHGITTQVGAEATVPESAMTEGLSEALRVWRMNATSLNSMQGTTIKATQTLFDAAMNDLNYVRNGGK